MASERFPLQRHLYDSTCPNDAVSKDQVQALSSRDGFLNHSDLVRQLEVISAEAPAVVGRDLPDCRGATDTAVEVPVKMHVDSGHSISGDADPCQSQLKADLQRTENPILCNVADVSAFEPTVAEESLPFRAQYKKKRIAETDPGKF